jgi:hypothetical protein
MIRPPFFLKAWFSHFVNFFMKRIRLILGIQYHLKKGQFIRFFIIVEQYIIFASPIR